MSSRTETPGFRDLRVALIAEGPTDAIVIEAALKALLPRPFILTQLQPEPTRPKLGTGWGGVLRWCLEVAKRGVASLESDPTLPGFDLFIIHADADIAECAYRDVSQEIAEFATKRRWPPLQNDFPCPPPTAAADAVRSCILLWMGFQELGPNTVLCVPSKAIEAWLAAAKFDPDNAMLTGLECNLKLEQQLAAMPRGQRIRKTTRDYRAHQKDVTDAWSVVRRRCSQAERFSTEVAAVRL